MPAVKPEILKWARETAGLSLDEAAHSIKLNPAYGKTGAERLEALELGEVSPSRQMLSRMAKAYRRSLLVFYLSKPPRQGDQGKDFRTLPGEVSALYDGNLDALLRDIRARQSLVKSLLEDEDAEPLDFIASSAMEQGHEYVAQRIQAVLGFSLSEYRAQKDKETAFKYLRRLVERSGIFVILIGNLGSHHTAIPLKVFRGFAIADAIAPFIAINDQDAPAAWSFTVLHEVSHLFLGSSGISGTSYEQTIERFCNDVAADILLPAQDLETLRGIGRHSIDTVVAEITDFAKARNLSRKMVAYNMLKTNIIDQIMWQELSTLFEQEWIAIKAKLKEKRKESGAEGGPDYYVVKRQRLGTAIVDLVSRSVGEGTISSTKAGKILGVKARNVSHLLTPPNGGV